MGSKRSGRKKRKAKKMQHNQLAETVLKVFSDHPFKSFNLSQVYKQLGVKDRSSRKIVSEMVHQLADEEAIVKKERGKYQLNPTYISEKISSSIITGRVDMKQTGKAYIITDELGEDVFIAANNTGQAMDGDTVKVHLFPKRSGRKTEGQIIEVLKRGHEKLVGTIIVSPKISFLIPDLSTIPIDILIPDDKLGGARDGDKVTVQLTNWPKHAKNPFGEVIDILGEPGENNVEMKSILVNYNFPVTFPKPVTSEAEKIDPHIPKKEYKIRRDFRDVITCTIDPPDAKDFDDALSLRKLENGNWEVGIHIADVSYYVRPESAIDQEGLKRATSVYLVDRVNPMLPEKLSNLVCSLRPNEDKLCFSAVFELDDEANVHNEWFGRTIINSDRRFNYEEVQAMIEGGEGDFKEELLTLNKLAQKMRAERFQKGSIAFSSQEVKFELDDEGKPLKAYIKEQKESNQLVEDFMLLANRKVAEKMGRRRGKSKPRTFVYRVHDQPNPEKLETFAEFISKLGYHIKLTSMRTLAKSLNKLFQQIKGKAEENMIESIAVRTMAKAEYSTQNIGHYGLGFKYYTHFTSPIRRYPDLMAHRLLADYLDGKDNPSPASYEDKCQHASEMERKAVEAERESVKYKQAEYMLESVGQEFDGLISGVSKWGIFVEIDESKAEGLVRLHDMDDDFYYLDEDNYRVVGSRHGSKYQLGDRVRILVKNVDLQKKQMDFKLV
ncbi:MAG: ribonuclease R [Bacteroidales bacterium]|nr:ribonuclease R [Bacteroidales bacterium]